MENLIMTDRISILKNKMLSEPRYASIEQAKIITDTYKANEETGRPGYGMELSFRKAEVPGWTGNLRPCRSDPRTDLKSDRKTLHISVRKSYLTGGGSP